MSHPADSFFAKLGRAKEQLVTLHADHATFITDAYTTRGEFESKRGNEFIYKLRVVATRDKGVIDDHRVEWAVRTGEVLHDLRSALDQLAYQLAGESAGEHTAFPITSGTKEWERMLEPPYGLSKVTGMTIGAINAIQSLQPHNGGDRERLALLRELSNWDKHRLLPLASFALKAKRWVLLQTDWAKGEITNFEPGEFHEGAVIGRLKVTMVGERPPGAPNMDVQVHPELTVEVVFDEGTPAEYRPVTELLANVAEFMETDVWIALEEFFPPLRSA